MPDFSFYAGAGILKSFSYLSSKGSKQCQPSQARVIKVHYDRESYGRSQLSMALLLRQMVHHILLHMICMGLCANTGIGHQYGP